MLNHTDNALEQMINDSLVRARVLEELNEQGLSLEGSLILSISSPNGQPYSLEKEDLYQVFSVYGNLTNISVQNTEAYITYEDIVSAYFAQRTLDGHQLTGSSLTLHLSWKTVPGSLDIWKKQATHTPKFTCRYVLDAEDLGFQIVRRIIGPKGAHMKKIITRCTKDIECVPHKVLKLRLRGIGSGFREGPANCESDEPLHLCVSSRIYCVFQLACEDIEKLLCNVKSQYEHFAKAKSPLSEFKIHKKFY